MNTKVLLALLPLALASPALQARQGYIPCSGVYNAAECCAVDVLGVADLECGSRNVP